MKKKKLKVRWSKREKDFVIHWPDYSWNGHLMHSFLMGYLEPKEFLQELQKRGYDITTLKIEVSKLDEPGVGSASGNPGKGNL